MGIITADIYPFFFFSFFVGSLKRMHEEDEELGTMQVAAAQNGWYLRTALFVLWIPAKKGEEN